MFAKAPGNHVLRGDGAFPGPAFSPARGRKKMKDGSGGPLRKILLIDVITCQKKFDLFPLFFFLQRFLICDFPQMSRAVHGALLVRKKQYHANDNNSPIAANLRSSKVLSMEPAGAAPPTCLDLTHLIHTKVESLHGFPLCSLPSSRGCCPKSVYPQNQRSPQTVIPAKAGTQRLWSQFSHKLKDTGFPPSRE